jgi:preprotein translocase subunit SecD
MLNKYPLWKYLLILFVISFGIVYALPNIYPPDPAIQVSRESTGQAISQSAFDNVLKTLKNAGIEVVGDERKDDSMLFRLAKRDDQLKAQSLLQPVLGDEYIVALNLAPTTPEWLVNIGAQPMKLGLDLSGGVHFLMEVDTQFAINNELKTYETEAKRALRKARVLGRVEIAENNALVMRFKTEELRDEARGPVGEALRGFQIVATEQQEGFLLTATMPETQLREIESRAVQQNLTTLRNRVNELGVAEPLVARQGPNRIVVELPGVQDTARAKSILGKTATLEFRLEAEVGASTASKEKFKFRDETQGYEAWLERKVVIEGKHVSTAASGFDENQRPNVNITLNSQGGSLMNRSTRDNIKRRLGVLFVERKTRTFYNDDGTVLRKEKYDQKSIISLATIQSALGSRFQITGLDNVAEASELALLLRAGALAAPIDFLEERTVGPSLGAENIELGVKSVQIGMGLVLIFMLLYYKVFGLAANLALMINVVLLVAAMSILSATLTLPGIAGIVLTVGMAVDANVLIFARIKEELKNGMSPQAAIDSGYGRAFVTIMDANITTLLVAIILYAVGTGPIKGFAVTLSIGILTSMFTAIMGTRALVNLIYGGRRVKRLMI